MVHQLRLLNRPCRRLVIIGFAGKLTATIDVNKKSKESADPIIIITVNPARTKISEAGTKLEIHKSKASIPIPTKSSTQ